MGGVCVDRIQYLGGEETKGSRMESFRQEMIFDSENIFLCILLGINETIVFVCVLEMLLL